MHNVIFQFITFLSCKILTIISNNASVERPPDFTPSNFLPYLIQRSRHQQFTTLLSIIKFTSTIP